MKTPIIAPPEGFAPALKQGRAWCPYCGREVAFGWDARLDTARCMKCGTSERDFYVRQYNGLWPDDSLEKFEHAVKKSGFNYDAPFSWQLPAEINDKHEEQKSCELCGKAFVPAGNRQKYCAACGDAIRREQRKRAVYRHREKRAVES